MRASAPICIGIALALALSPSGARADDASDWKQQGDSAFDAKHFEQALALYSKAYRAEKSASVAFNLARTYEALGQLGSALDYFEAFRRDATPEVRNKVPNIDALIARTAGRVATVTITCSQAEADVRIRGESFGKTPLAGPVRTNGGRATIELTLAGHQPFTRTLQLPEGGSVVVDATLLPQATSGVVQVTPPTRDGSEPSIVSKWWFWTAVGVVAVSGGVAIYALSSERSGDQGSLGSLRAGGAFLHF